LPGTASRRELRFAGAGYPARGKRPAGDLIVTLLPIFARQLSPRQRTLLLRAHREVDSNLPDIADWREKLRAEDVAES
jgi:molecular chaperone DnaJ